MTLINTLVLGIFMSSGDSGTSAGISFSTPMLMFIGWFYFIFMDVKFGFTVGKKVMSLRVQNMENGKNLSWLSAILRETIGRLISGLVFCLGYFWVLWDPKKQAWHDKLGKSVVVRQ